MAGGRPGRAATGVDERRAEEAALAAELLANRERAAASRAYADDGLIQRVARAEGHLSRELDRALTLLARLQAGRDHKSTAVRAVGFVWSDREVRAVPELPADGTG